MPQTKCLYVLGRHGFESKGRGQKDPGVSRRVTRDLGNAKLACDGMKRVYGLARSSVCDGRCGC